MTGKERYSILTFKRKKEPVNKMDKGFLQAQTHLVAKPDPN